MLCFLRWRIDGTGDRGTNKRAGPTHHGNRIGDVAPRNACGSEQQASRPLRQLRQNVMPSPEPFFAAARFSSGTVAGQDAYLAFTGAALLLGTLWLALRSGGVGGRQERRERTRTQKPHSVPRQLGPEQGSGLGSPRNGAGACFAAQPCRHAVYPHPLYRASGSTGCCMPSLPPWFMDRPMVG